jgi:hypothetical protein
MVGMIYMMRFSSYVSIGSGMEEHAGRIGKHSKANQTECRLSGEQEPG